MKYVIFSFLYLAFSLSAMSAEKFTFQDGDRVVFLGSTFTEREQKYGWVETHLQLASKAKGLTFRNLGWSGDTVYGHARSYFGPPAEGLERLSKHLEFLKPTVLVCYYGADLPFEGLSSLPDFLSGYRKLLDLAHSKAPNLRTIIVSPTPLENLGAPLPNMNQANGRLKELTEALKGFAAQQNATFVNGYELMGGDAATTPSPPLTINGVHYAENGYKIWAQKITQALGLQLPKSTPEQLESIRKEVVKKDELFFNRWRPANETYLYGFRKHEQGQNAAEIERFDPLVKEKEKQIETLKEQLKSARLP